MTKTLFFLFFASAFCFAQNSLMVSPQTGTMITAGTVNNFKLISDGNSVALVAANNATGKIFIVDINDKNPADKTANTIPTSSGTVKARIGAAIGQTVTSIKNIEVNPISNAVYAMAMVNTTPYFVKLTNGGNTVTALNFNAMPYCMLNFTSANCTFQDITWGGNNLFISSNHNTLNGELGYISAPFTHNTTITKRSTTMFKSNWAGTYYTTAPLEKLNYINIGGTEYLCGVTTCAPGFSETVSSFTNNSGLFTVRESFDMVFGSSNKTVPMNNGPEAYLLNLHDNGTVYRIGKKFLDGSPMANNTINNNSVQLRNFSGGLNPNLSATDISSYPGGFSSMAYYSPCELLTLSADHQTLSRLTVCNALLSVAEPETNSVQFVMSPNPATDLLHISYNDNLFKNAEVSVYSYDGKLIKKQALHSKNRSVSISELTAGNYILKISNNGTQVYSGKFIKK